MKAYLNANRISVLSDKAYYYATKREAAPSSAYVSPEDFYEVMRLIAVEILNADLEEAHKDQILAEFLIVILVFLVPMASHLKLNEKINRNGLML